MTRPRLTLVIVPAVIVTLMALLLAGCERTRSESLGAHGVAPSPAVAVAPANNPGSVVGTQPWQAAVPHGTLVGRAVTYWSTDRVGRPIQVTGTVFLPAGRPPAGGWPVMALGHGTVGINENCAPRFSPDLTGMSRSVLGFLRRGMAVTLADFSGLGAPGVHPYLDAQAAGRTIIDSVRALRRLEPDVGTTWMTYGISQGGGAAWAADELAGSYAPELRLRGAVAQVPAADNTGMADQAANGLLTPEQQGIMYFLIESLARSHPELNRDDYRHGELARVWPELDACSKSPMRAHALSQVTAGDFIPSSPEATARLRGLIAEGRVPQQKSAAPLLVIYGGRDMFIDHRWIESSISRACARGDVVDVDYQPERGHLDVDISAMHDWVGQRLSGVAATRDDCPR
ncbi:lipase family protein [Williamsia sterculiae]|uniref:lipase family protein n=1 Tax=Williamsia sterculiae TaxID=1344003 RepID=UPI000970F8C6|nr:lipase family protein [Williamsia sterculiae]